MGDPSPMTLTISADPSSRRRVRDLDAMLAQLRAAGVAVEERIEELEFGRFGWAVDPEGNRFELWQTAA